MCERVGVAAPPDGEIDRLFREAIVWITARVKADAPGAAEAVRWLHGNGYRVFTASGEDSITLNGYLSAIGIRDCFDDRLYGPDLTRVTKSGVWFYERLFAESAVDPADALVIDDSAKAVGWAREVGAKALGVGTDLGGLRDLPEWLTHSLTQRPSLSGTAWVTSRGAAQLRPRPVCEHRAPERRPRSRWARASAAPIAVPD